MSQEHFDALETRDPAAREKNLFARLPAQIAHAMTAPGWAKHLSGVDPKSVTSRAALAKLPLLRKSDLPQLQQLHRPFGGLNGVPVAKLARTTRLGERKRGLDSAGSRERVDCGRPAFVHQSPRLIRLDDREAQILVRQRRPPSIER